MTGRTCPPSSTPRGLPAFAPAPLFRIARAAAVFAAHAVAKRTRFRIPDDRLRDTPFVFLGLFVGLAPFNVFTLDNPLRGAARVEPTIYRTPLEAWGR